MYNIQYHRTSKYWFIIESPPPEKEYVEGQLKIDELEVLISKFWQDFEIQRSTSHGNCVGAREIYHWRHANYNPGDSTSAKCNISGSFYNNCMVTSLQHTVLLLHIHLMTGTYSNMLTFKTNSLQTAYVWTLCLFLYAIWNRNRRNLVDVYLGLF